MLRSSRNLERFGTIQGWNADFAAECRLCKSNRQRVMQIITVTLEVLVRLEFQKHVQVAARTVVQAVVARVRDAQSVATVDAFGQRDHDLLGFDRAAPTVTNGARIRVDLAGAFAGLAWCRRHEVAQDRALHLPNLSGPAAGLAGLQALAPRLAAFAVAMAATLEPVHFNFNVGPVACLLERDARFNLQVLAACRTVATSGATALIAEDIAAEDAVEQVEDVAHAAVRVETCTRCTADFAVLVVLGAFFWIGERPVSLVDLLEFFFGLFVPRILVRVEFEGQGSVGAFDFIAIGGFVHAEKFVVIH